MLDVVDFPIAANGVLPSEPVLLNLIPVVSCEALLPISASFCVLVLQDCEGLSIEPVIREKRKARSLHSEHSLHRLAVMLLQFCA